MLKRKINQADYDKLSDNIKFEYKKSKDDEYVLDVDDAADLISARDNANRERDEFKRQLDDTKKELKTIKDSNSNWETMEASYKNKIAGLEAERDTANATLTGERRDRHTATEAAKIAAKFTVPSVMLPLIQKRLDIKTDASGGVSVVVLDKTGKHSASTLVDLEKEFVDNAEYKPMVIAHKGSGSAGGNLPAVPGKQPDPNNPQSNLYSKMTPEAIAADRKARKEAAAATGAA